MNWISSFLFILFIFYILLILLVKMLTAAISYILDRIQISFLDFFLFIVHMITMRIVHIVAEKNFNERVLLIFKLFFDLFLRTERNNDKLKDPFHCALFLTDCFADLLSATDTQQKLSEAISRYQLQQLKERILQGRKPTEPPQKPVGAQGNVIRENRICAYHFAGLLKVKSPEGKLFQCKKSTCTYNHLRLASMTHKTIYETIETLPSPLKESCRAAYPSLK